MAAWEQRQSSAPTSSSSPASSASASTTSGTSNSRVLEPTAPPTDPDAIARAAAFKDEGNRHFAAKRYREALGKYTESIRTNGSVAASWSNRSACYLAMGDAENALLDAEVCRKLEPSWPKGCYRYENAMRIDKCIIAS
jgi:tetratricopeptide (TPR) repeat protein